VIYGILKTRDAISPVPANALLSTLVAFICVYTVFISTFLIFTVRIVRRGPGESPAYAEASGSLKNAFRPHVLDSRKQVVNSHIA
jgi:cytochrome d ubiquinol oxidase subunit I